MDPSALTVGVSVLNRVVCTYSSFEQLVVFVCFNIREFKEAKRIPCLRYIFSEDSVRGKNHMRASIYWYLLMGEEEVLQALRPVLS